MGETVTAHKTAWNPWHGCHKCSEGCRNCYMYALDKMRGVETDAGVVRKTNDFDMPLRKNRQKEYKVKSGERINVNMTSDTFVEEADEWRDEMWDIIRQRPDVVFWVLTKRPERYEGHLPKDWGDGYDNVIMSITCENQEMFDKRIDYLLNLPAKHKGLCLAPLISDIDISRALRTRKIEEVFVGGERYDDPRPCRLEWVEHISRTCEYYKTNFVFYETGTNFWAKDKSYWFQYKNQQSAYAYFSGLNRRFYDVLFDLKDIDGNIIVPRKRQFNASTCLFCSNQACCNGCTKCGTCKDVNLMNEDEFLLYQEARMKEHDYHR